MKRTIAVAVALSLAACTTAHPTALPGGGQGLCYWVWRHTAHNG
jgi:hypothetical protein